MKIEELIISELAHDLQQRLVENTMHKLRKESVKFLGEEVADCIENSWEEYCVSIQDKTFSKELKDVIAEHVLEFFSYEFRYLKEFEKVSIWIKSKEGTAWFYENKEISIDLEKIPFKEIDCQEDFLELLSKKAETFENDNIYRYINLDCSIYQENYDDDGKLEVYE